MANERKEADVPSILKKDGVEHSIFDQKNKVKVNVNDIINNGCKTSFSHTLINTESNSATLISQLPGEGNRRHYHSDWDEWWYILAGKWQIEIEGDIIIAEKDDVVLIQRGNKHQITAIGDEPAVRIAVSRYDVDHIYEEN